MLTTEVWARGNNAFGQLVFQALGRGNPGQDEPRDLEEYEKVFEAKSVEWVRAGEFGTVGM